jgi:hypothetical protein
MADAGSVCSSKSLESSSLGGGAARVIVLPAYPGGTATVASLEKTES